MLMDYVDILIQYIILKHTRVMEAMIGEKLECNDQCCNAPLHHKEIIDPWPIKVLDIK